ncbi:hypothetical protein A3768_5050 (plasmid) [Ralstonia solanacearum]|nr:hypothetical protein A3768_5050 [Ralstonia solanacearum]
MLFIVLSLCVLFLVCEDRGSARDAIRPDASGLGQVMVAGG